MKYSHSILFETVTRSVSRAMRRYQIIRLLGATVIIKRNRKLDGLSLGKCNVIITRRASTMTRPNTTVPALRRYQNNINLMSNAPSSSSVELAPIQLAFLAPGVDDPPAATPADDVSLPSSSGALTPNRLAQLAIAAPGVDDPPAVTPVDSSLPSTSIASQNKN